MNELIIFDCDGTLVDSEYAHNFAVSRILAEEGLSDYTVEQIEHRFTGFRFGHVLDIVSRETGYIFPQNTRQRYIEQAHALIPVHQKTIEGAAIFIKAAAARGKIALASNGHQENVMYSLEISGLLPLFNRDHIFTGLSVANPKPAPDIYLLAAKTLGVEPSKCAVIEDSLVGVTAGVAAGMTTYGFTGTHHDPENHAKTLQTAGAHHVFNTLIHIQDHLHL